jgi:amino acid transporter
MLRRRLSLLQSVSLNMATMVGIGPFITIPMFLDKLPGPPAMLGWILGALIAVCDGLVWSELAAAFPGSGGTFHFYDAIYGSSRVGRLLKFLFVWQFLFSGPLELASGLIGVSRYAGYFWGWLNQEAWNLQIAQGVAWHVDHSQLLAVLGMVTIVALAYRRVEEAGRLMVVLWLGMVGTMVWVIVAAWMRFDATTAFSMPPESLVLDRRFAVGLGGTMGLAMYCFLGYYQVCYMGDEVTNPARTIPRAILISVLVIAAAYLAMNVGILGVIPWREVQGSPHIVSDFMLRLHGPWAARLVTLLIVWSAIAGTFALVLSYSRVPYAAARSGHFFSILAKTHPTGEFPHYSLLLIGTLAAITCLADLESVIAALLTSRILIQFVGQIVTVFYLRSRPDLLQRMPFRMILYPLPALFALGGWLYVFGTSDMHILLYGLFSLVAGIVAFAIWSLSLNKPKQELEQQD